MDTKVIAAIAVFATMSLGGSPARAQHGGGHSGGGHGGGHSGGAGGGHSASGHSSAPVRGTTHGGPVVGHATTRAGPAPHVSGSIHSGALPHPSVHGSIGLGLAYGYPYGYGYGYPYYGYGAYPYGYGSYGSGYAYPSGSTAFGSVRIVGAPRDAEVYADGYYVGVVDDFDGAFQHLDLEAGPHQIEIHLPGAAPLAFAVNVQPGRTITYRASAGYRP